MARSPFSVGVDYIDTSFLAEGQFIGDPVVSEGAKAVGFKEPVGPREVQAFLERKNPATGLPFAEQHEKTLKWVYCRQLTVHPSVNALFDLIALTGPEELKSIYRQVIVPAYVAAQRVAAEAVYARYKVNGEKKTVKAEPITLGVPHLLARPVNGVSQISVHVNELSVQPVVVPATGITRSEAQSQSRDWIWGRVNEVFQRSTADGFQRLDFNAEYADGCCVIRGIKTEFQEAVTGARTRQIDEYLRAEGVAPSVGARRIAALKTAEDKPEFQSPEDVAKHLEKTIAMAQTAAQKYGQTLEACKVRQGATQEFAQKGTTDDAWAQRSQAAFAEYAYRKEEQLQPQPAPAQPQPQNPQQPKAPSTPAGRMLAQRMPYVRQGIKRVSGPVYRRITVSKPPRYKVTNAEAFLDASRKMPHREAARRASRKIRRETHDRDWNGVATLGRLAARWAALYATYRTSHVRLPEGARLEVPKTEWERLKASGNLGKFYVRAERNGWKLAMQGMEQQAHARRVRVARKAIRHNVDKRQQYEGFSY